MIHQLFAAAKNAKRQAAFLRVKKMGILLVQGKPNLRARQDWAGSGQQGDHCPWQCRQGHLCGQVAPALRVPCGDTARWQGRKLWRAGMTGWTSPALPLCSRGGIPICCRASCLLPQAFPSTVCPMQSHQSPDLHCSFTPISLLTSHRPDCSAGQQQCRGKMAVPVLWMLTGQPQSEGCELGWGQLRNAADSKSHSSSQHSWWEPIWFPGEPTETTEGHWQSLLHRLKSELALNVSSSCLSLCFPFPQLSSLAAKWKSTSFTVTYPACQERLL